MAEISTHVFFSKDVMKEFNCSNSIKYFSLGPDVFYFNKKTKPYAKMMHRNNTLLFFKNYIKYIKENHLTKNDYVIGSLYGFLSHYVLDSTVHPYIFYKTGLYKGMHRTYEMAFTKYLLLKNKINPSSYQFYKELDFKVNEDMVKLLNTVLKQTYDIDNGGVLYYDSLKKAKNVYRFLRYDRFGIKKRFYTLVDLVFDKRVANSSFYNIEDADFNINHKYWLHPCTKKRSKESLIDLYEDSHVKLYEIIKKVNLVLKNKLDIDELDKILGNYSLITGLDCNDKRIMKYYDNSK